MPEALSSDSTILPDKLYFKIGEASELVGVKPYVLRYWETEFEAIEPVKSKTGQRLYRRKDVEVLLKIRDLLYKQKFTINGAKRKIKTDVVKPVSPQLGLLLNDEAQTQTNTPWHSIKVKLLGELDDLLKEMHESL